MVIKINYTNSQPIIKINYDVSPIYIKTSISKVYVKISYGGSGGLTSVGLVMPSAFSVANSPLTANGDITVSGSGSSLEYIDGTGALQTFPTLLESDSLITEVRNQSGATMTKGTIVYISGATGNKALISKAIATGDATSAQTFGMVQDDIANNAVGNIVIIGDVFNLNTFGITEGTQLYLSGTTAGTWTTTKPYAPLHLVYVGIVLREHINFGIIGVKIQNGYELDELHDVSARTPSNNDGIFFNSSTNLWTKNSISGVLGYTPESALTFSSPLSRSVNTISIPVATSLVNGYLSSTDWTTFNGKYNLPSLTSSSVLFFDGTNIAQNNSQFFWNNLTNILGIGTATPTVAKINIKYDSTVNRAIRLQDNNVIYDFVTSGGGENGSFGIYNQTAGAYRFYIRSGGNVIIGGSTDNGYKLDVTGTTRLNGKSTLTGSVTAAAALAQGVLVSPTLVAAANNDVLVGMDITPTFTNGAFTGVNNIALRVNGILNTSSRLNVNGATDSASYAMSVNGNFTATTIYANNGNGSVQCSTINSITGSNQIGIRFQGNQSEGIRLGGGTFNGNGTLYPIFITRTYIINNVNDRLNYVTISPDFTASFTGTIIRGLYVVTGTQTSGTFRAIETQSGSIVLNDFVSIGKGSEASTSSILDLTSTTKGFLPPRMTNAQRTAIGTPAVGLIVYCTDTVEGLYIYKSTGWTFVI